MKSKQYIRDGLFTLEDVLTHVITNQAINKLRHLMIKSPGFSRSMIKAICNQAKIRYYNGHPVRMNSTRYQLFASKGCKCVHCGLQGTYFALEKDPYTESDLYHFNLYGRNPDGEEIMLTKDHIHPKAKGGANTLSNYQTMCQPCNNTKADSIILLTHPSLTPG